MVGKLNLMSTNECRRIPNPFWMLTCTFWFALSWIWLFFFFEGMGKGNIGFPFAIGAWLSPSEIAWASSPYFAIILDLGIFFLTAFYWWKIAILWKYAQSQPVSYYLRVNTCLCIVIATLAIGSYLAGMSRMIGGYFVVLVISPLFALLLIKALELIASFTTYRTRKQTARVGRGKFSDWKQLRLKWFFWTIVLISFCLAIYQSLNSNISEVTIIIDAKHEIHLKKIIEQECDFNPSYRSIGGGRNERMVSIPVNAFHQIRRPLILDANKKKYQVSFEVYRFNGVFYSLKTYGPKQKNT